MDMDSTGVKFSGGKIVPHLVIRAGTTSGNTLAENREVWRALCPCGNEPTGSIVPVS